MKDDAPPSPKKQVMAVMFNKHYLLCPLSSFRFV